MYNFCCCRVCVCVHVCACRYVCIHLYLSILVCLLPSMFVYRSFLPKWLSVVNLSKPVDDIWKGKLNAQLQLYNLYFFYFTRVSFILTGIYQFLCREGFAVFCCDVNDTCWMCSHFVVECAAILLLNALRFCCWMCCHSLLRLRVSVHPRIGEFLMHSSEYHYATRFPCLVVKPLYGFGTS